MKHGLFVVLDHVVLLGEVDAAAAAALAVRDLVVVVVVDKVVGDARDDDLHC